MSSTQGGFIRLLLVHITPCNVEPMPITVSQMVMTKIWFILKVWSHQNGEESPQFLYLCWNWSCLLWNVYVRYQTSILQYFLMPWHNWPNYSMPRTTYTMSGGFQCIWRAWLNFPEGIHGYSVSRMFRENCFKVQKTKVLWTESQSTRYTSRTMLASKDMVEQLLSGVG
jgi:hypothetical protein